MLPSIKNIVFSINVQYNFHKNLMVTMLVVILHDVVVVMGKVDIQHNYLQLNHPNNKHK